MPAQRGYDEEMARKLTGTVVIATHNPGKLKEMSELLSPYGIATQSASDLGLPEPAETGKTFAANASIKAVAAALASGKAAFADDSGLVVDALGGEPGIHSARWAGPARDFRVAMNRVQTLLIERGATTSSAFRRSIVSGLARPPRRGIRRPC
jgi:XTP/dITP diphosphohydrolase